MEISTFGAKLIEINRNSFAKQEYDSTTNNVKGH